MEIIEKKIPAGTEISVQHLMNPEGIPTIACHGWLDNSDSFVRIASALKQLNVTAIDLAGHGKSEHRSKDAGYHFVDWIPDVFDVADHLQLPEFGMIGHSMGAGIASLAAGSSPERVKFLVLIDGLAPMTAKVENLPDRLNRRMIASKRMSQKSPITYTSIDEALDARFSTGKFSNKEVIRAMVCRNLKQVKNGYQWTYDPRLKLPSSIRLSTDQVKAFLKKITCPVLVIRAKNGLPIDLNEAKDMINSLSNVTYHEIEGNHHVHLDKPDVVASLINDFISKI